jgi:hypothetical protein
MFIASQCQFTFRIAFSSDDDFPIRLNQMGATKGVVAATNVVVRKLFQKKLERIIWAPGRSGRSGRYFLVRCLGKLGIRVDGSILFPNQYPHLEDIEHNLILLALKLCRNAPKFYGQILST